MSIKLPSSKPHSSAFMVFSMLLLGVFAAALIVVFDFWFYNERSLSFIVLRKIKETEAPIVWIASVSGLTLMASGFFFYLLSFFMLTAPAFYVRQLFHRDRNAEVDLFRYVSDQALSRFVADHIAKSQSRKFMDGFMYLLLTSTDSQISSAARFSFTQLMFARSLAPIILLFSVYICYVTSAGTLAIIAIPFFCWLVLCVLYGYGLVFYENVMTSGVLIQGLHKDKTSTRTRKKSNSAVNPDATQ